MYMYSIEASRGAGAQSVTVKPTGCGFDPHSRRWNIYLNLYFHFFALIHLPLNTNSDSIKILSIITIAVFVFDQKNKLINLN